MFDWHLYAILVLLLAGVWIGAAGIVFLTRPERPQNRWLAAMLFAEGAAWVANALWLAATDPSLHRALVMADWTAWLLVPIFYLLFLRTLPSPLARPLRHPIGLTGIIGVGGGFQLALLLFRDRFYVGVQTGHLGAHFEAVTGPGFQVFVYFFAAVCFYAFLVALSAWRRAPVGSMQRSQAGAYALAFGIRDVSIVAFAFYGIVRRLLEVDPHPIAGTTWAIQAAIFVALLAYGILRTQLFSIDLKIKWTISRGTLVAIFLGMFFVVTVTAENFLTDRYGWAVGGVAAGLLLFALNPLVRLAERVSNAALPGVAETPMYRELRRKEIYRATLEEMFADGAVTAKERRTLIRLQEQLGLTAAIAQQIELDILAMPPE